MTVAAVGWLTGLVFRPTVRHPELKSIEVVYSIDVALQSVLGEYPPPITMLDVAPSHTYF